MARPLPFDPIAEAGRHWRKRWGPASVPPMTAVTSVMRVHQLMLARLNEALEPHGLTFARYEALMLLFLSRSGSLPLGKIGERLQVHPTSVTNLVDGLERSGLSATETLNGIAFGTAPLARKDLEAVTRIFRGMRLEAGDFVD